MMIKSTIGERIQQLITEFSDGVNSKFAKEIGVNESNIRSYISGTLPKYDVLSIIAEKFAINCEWLLTGKGSMLKNDQPVIAESVLPNSAETNQYFIEKIMSMAEEIGSLKEQIRQLKREKGNSASDATGSAHANVG